MRVKSLLGEIVLTGVHSEGVCAGRHCVIHNPVRPNEVRRLLWRNDRGFFEEVCPCGIGHPSPEDIEFWETTGQTAYRAVHGCCGIHCYTAGYVDDEEGGCGGD